MNIDKIEGLIKKFDMLPVGMKILCAVSGGRDSVCLLHFLKNRGGNEIICAHFNHRLRGQESNRDEQFVKNLCKSLGIKCFTASGNVLEHAKQSGMSIEEAARDLRYEFLQKTAQEANAGRIATAHNASDNAETVLLNMARGTGLRGVCGIPPVRDNIIRPLLLTQRAEIESYLAENRFDYVEDSSNLSDDYSRNRLRHKVLPAIEETNLLAISNISKMSLSLREDESFLSGLAEEFLEKNLEGDAILAQKLKNAPLPIAYRALKSICDGAGRIHLESILSLCDAKKRTAVDIPGMRVVFEQGRLIFGRNEEIKSIQKQYIEIGKKMLIGSTGLELESEKVKISERINNSFNTFFFNYENICGKIFVASRSSGDKIELFGRNCTKTVKKLFNEACLPLKDREETPILYDDEGVIAIYGFGVAKRCAAAQGDDAIKIEIKRTDGHFNAAEKDG